MSRRSATGRLAPGKPRFATKVSEFRTVFDKLSLVLVAVMSRSAHDRKKNGRADQENSNREQRRKTACWICLRLQPLARDEWMVLHRAGFFRSLTLTRS